MLRPADVRAWAVIGLLAAAPASTAAQESLSPDVDAQLAFLQTAKIVSSRPIGKGITGALRVTLTDGRLTHDAAFQRVQEQTTAADRARGRRRAGELNYVDHFRYNIAAWRLARLIGLGHMMPATVQRTIDREAGALSWWVDDVLMDEAGRESTGANPTNMIDFSRQWGRMSVFAELVRDTDRNKGNVVYTKDWRVVMLDFTRAFRLQPELRRPEVLTGCDRALLARLRTLTAAEVTATAQEHLTAPEVSAVMARRDLIVGHFERLIAERGEAAVLY